MILGKSSRVLDEKGLWICLPSDWWVHARMLAQWVRLGGLGYKGCFFVANIWPQDSIVMCC
jgi:hypothetical protein